MSINKVEYFGNTLIDLTSDTLETSDQLLEGIVAHNRAGDVILGTLVSGYGITLPDGYGVEIGIYKPTTDISSAVTIDLKNTFRWDGANKTSACYILMVCIDVKEGTQAAALGAHVKFGIGERDHQMVSTKRGNSTSSTVFANPSSKTTFNQITLTGNSAYPLKADHSYLWMVIGELIT